MAIFHLSYRGCSPATGAGAVRKAAYQSGQALVEERTGELCDYARKERVAEDGLFLPAGVPPIDRGSLWNGAERAWAEGGGGNELVAKRYEFALPIELDACARRACVLDFCALFPAKACDWAIHDDGRGGNPHAHVLVSALDLGAQGFTQRTKAEKGQCFYLCQNARGVQAPVRATDWKQAKADGWEKVYNFKDGVRRTMKQAKAEGLGTKDRASKQPVQMHRIARQSARDVGSAELTAIRAAWAEIANRHLAAYAARWRFAISAQAARMAVSSALPTSRADCLAMRCICTGCLLARSFVPSPSAFACFIVRRTPSLKLYTFSQPSAFACFQSVARTGACTPRAFWHR